MQISCAPPSAGAPAPGPLGERLGHVRGRGPGSPDRCGDARTSPRRVGRLTLAGGAEQVCGKLASPADAGGTEIPTRLLGPAPVREPTAPAAAAAPS